MQISLWISVWCNWLAHFAGNEEVVSSNLTADKIFSMKLNGTLDYIIAYK